MTEEAQKKIIIKKGSMKLEINRSDLLDVNSTHDGIAFNFKEGLQLYFTDNFMPQTMKEIIQNTANHYSNQKIIFDLNNQIRPAMIDAT